MSGDSRARSTWAATLDDYARVLDRHAAALADPDVDPTAIDPFVPPPDLGPLPEELRGRAAELVARSRDLTADAERQLARTPTPPTRRVPARRRPTTFDQRA